MFFSINLYHGQGYWSYLQIQSIKNIHSNTQKTVLSFSADHASSASNLTGTSILSQLDNKYITINQNSNNTSNTYDIHSCVKPQKQNYSVQATSTTNSLTELKTTLPILPLELHTTIQLPPVGKEYLCLHIENIFSCCPVCQFTDNE